MTDFRIEKPGLYRMRNGETVLITSVDPSEKWGVKSNDDAWQLNGVHIQEDYEASKDILEFIGENETSTPIPSGKTKAARYAEAIDALNGIRPRVLNIRPISFVVSDCGGIELHNDDSEHIAFLTASDAISLLEWLRENFA